MTHGRRPDDVSSSLLPGSLLFAAITAAWLVACGAVAVFAVANNQGVHAASPTEDEEGRDVVAATGDADKSDVAGKLGVEPGMVVQELGWDDDTDDEVRAAVEERCGEDLLDEDAQEVVDVVLLWWRDGDGDLVDTLMDARSPLTDNGVVWVLTPKTGHDGHVEPSEIAEAAPTAGLSQTSNVSISEGWVGSRLVAPKSGKGRR